MKGKENFTILLMGIVLTTLGGTLGMAQDTVSTAVRPASIDIIQPAPAGENSVFKHSTVQMKRVQKGHLYIPQGTKIKLLLVDSLTTKTYKKGAHFHLKTVDNLLINDVIVIAKGTVVEGVVADSRGRGLFGRDAKLDIEIPYVNTVNGISVPVSGRFGGNLIEGGGSVIGLQNSFISGGILIQGGRVELNSGQEFTVTVKSDTDLGATPENLAMVMKSKEAKTRDANSGGTVGNTLPKVQK